MSLDAGDSGSNGTVTVLEDWLTRQELAAQLRVSVDTLGAWGTQGIGPIFIRVGGRTYYRRSTVREWLISLESRRSRRT